MEKKIKAPALSFLPDGDTDDNVNWEDFVIIQGNLLI
jgi:hypothetical protein